MGRTIPILRWSGEPGGDRRSRRAGYVAAATALVAALGFVGVAAVEDETLVQYGLGAIPLVVPVAFVVPRFVWEQRPEELRFRGAIFGLLTTLVTYLVAGVLSGPLVVVVIGFPDIGVREFLSEAFAISLT